MKTKLLTHLKSSALIAGAIVTTMTAKASTDYGPAIWDPPHGGCTKWYTSGYGHHFAVIHDMEDYYWGGLSGLDNCATDSYGNWISPFSVFYAINGVKDTSTDSPAGEVRQCVRESYYAWHVGCWNLYMWGTEHEGWASNPAWYTEAMYQSSSKLQRHLCDVG